MAFSVDEPDDDAARVEKAHVKFLGLTVNKLLAIRAHLTGPESRFVSAMDTQINVFGRMPTEFDLKGLKELAWKHRRLMPAPIAPKLPPHDPIVQEMESTK